MTGLDKGEMFRDLSPDEPEAGERAAPTGKKDVYRPVIPVPSDAPDPDWGAFLNGCILTSPWTYQVDDGGTAVLLARVIRNGEKDYQPVTWDGFRWRLKAMPAPRPLYEYADRLVVVVEGEKCADAACEVFQWHVVTTWSHGCKAWKQTNWQPLAGREVLLVADANNPGRKAMEAVAKCLHSLGCKVLYLPEGDDGKDIADWIKADGADDVRERIEAGAKRWMPMDWKDELAERAKTDPGAPFVQDMLVRLAELRRDNTAEWQRLR